MKNACNLVVQSLQDSRWVCLVVQEYNADVSGLGAVMEEVSVTFDYSTLFSNDL